MHSCNLTFDLLKNQAIKLIKNDSTGNIDNGYVPINVMPLPNWGRPCNQIPLKKSGSDWGFDFYSLTMQSEVIKFPIIGSLSSVKPSSIKGGVAVHYFDLYEVQDMTTLNEKLTFLVLGEKRQFACIYLHITPKYLFIDNPCTYY